MMKFLIFLCSFIPVLVIGQISTNLPIVNLTVTGEIPDEPAIPGSMGVVFDSSGGLNTETDVPNIYDGDITIETRGQSSQSFEKKSYTIRLKNADSSENPQSLLGMPSDDVWILHALHIDKSLMRIPMSFYFSERMGHYATRRQYVEVFLNGNYRGLYMLCEKIETGDNRVQVGNGYILRIDWDDGSGGFDSNYESMGGVDMTFQYYDPKGSAMTQSYKDNLKSDVKLFEQALIDPANMRPYRDYSILIDMESFADFLLVNELSKCSDGYKLSTYFHKADTGKLTAGPIWDFDQTYGLSMVCSNDNPYGWTYLQNQAGCEDLNTMPIWWEHLTAKKEFADLLVDRWQTFRNTFLHTDSIYSWIDSNWAYIDDAQTRNFERWPILGTDIWIEPQPLQPDYPSEIAYMKVWIKKRVEWIDVNIQNIYDFASSEGVKVYPNPSVGQTNIVITSGGPAKVVDLAGRLIWSSLDECENTSFTIDVSKWSIGTYIVYVKTTRGVYSEKLVVR